MVSNTIRPDNPVTDEDVFRVHKFHVENRPVRNQIGDNLVRVDSFGTFGTVELAKPGAHNAAVVATVTARSRNGRSRNDLIWS